jgi:hypothetical protein
VQVYDKPKSWSNAFTRSMYCRPDRPLEVIVVYEGDATKAGQFPHGNDQVGTRNFVRTQPHVIRTAQSSTSSVKTTYQNLVASAGPLQPSSSTAAPRNTAQIKNAMTARRNAGRLTHDALYNLTEFAHDAEFVQKIVLYPDLEVFLLYRPTLEKLRALISSQCNSGKCSLFIYLTINKYRQYK